MSQTNNRVSYASVAGRNTNGRPKQQTNTSPTARKDTDDEYPPIGATGPTKTCDTKQNNCKAGSDCCEKAAENLTLEHLHIEEAPGSKNSVEEQQDGKSWAGLFKHEEQQTSNSPERNGQELDGLETDGDELQFENTESVSLNLEEEPSCSKSVDQAPSSESAYVFPEADSFPMQYSLNPMGFVPMVNQMTPQFPMAQYVPSPYGFMTPSGPMLVSNPYYQGYYPPMDPMLMQQMVAGPSGAIAHPLHGMVYYQYDNDVPMEAFSPVLYPQPVMAPIKPLMHQVVYPIDSSSNTKPSTGDGWNNAVDAMRVEQKIAGKMDLVICERYQTYLKISRGSMGTVFAAVDLLDPQRKSVAVKFEDYSENRSNLTFEYEVYKACSVSEMNGIVCGVESEGFARIFWMGQQFKYRILIMQLLGPSLETLFSFAMRQFSPETIFRLGNQMLDRIERLHSAGFVHRDVKPDNFVMGLDSLENTVYLIDFGLSRKIRNSDNNVANYRKDKSLVGTAKYASMNSHKGLQLSRRDDLESIGYILVEFINGELPWKPEQWKNSSKETIYRNMLESKKATNWGTKCPEMADWLSYTIELQYNDEPDYNHLRQILLRNLEQAQSRPQRATPLSDHLAKVTYPEGQSKRKSPKHEARNVNSALERVQQSTFEWITRRESCPNDKYSYECLYRWTLPFGHEPLRPPGDNPSNVFGCGFGEGGFA